MSEFLSKEQAFKAMHKFIEMQYEQVNKPVVLASLLGDMYWSGDKYKTSDPAMWKEWLKAVQYIEEIESKIEKGQNNV